LASLNIFNLQQMTLFEELLATYKQQKGESAVVRKVIEKNSSKSKKQIDKAIESQILSPKQLPLGGIKRRKRQKRKATAQKAAERSMIEAQVSQEMQTLEKEVGKNGTAVQQQADQVTESKRTQRIAVQRRLPCKFFMEGKCKKGEVDCPFSHDVTPNKTVSEAKKEEVCKFYLRKACLKGDLCPYGHDTSSLPCRFYSTFGNCREGDACAFSHAIKGPLPKTTDDSASLDLGPRNLVHIIHAIDERRIQSKLEQASQSKLKEGIQSKLKDIVEHACPLPNLDKGSTAVSYNPFLETS
jgi:hypothetical protein